MRHIIITLLILSSIVGFSQSRTDYASYPLRAPLDIPLLLSGNFAELRSHHFHAGLDFKTQGRTGLPIYAPADGYVSRINISTAGYGNALYIDHPELNLTTVYGHLTRYAPAIDSLAKAKHYELEKYNINFFPEKEAIKIKKGDIIAYSGNTGSSAGPHLHFETRDRATQDPINPLFFGFDIKDTMAPSINGLRIYPLQCEGVIYHNEEGS
jgi:murein DD-endopeptidase MepM/ murein hydrolase activator NlpD